jgi:hypothetical protein
MLMKIMTFTAVSLVITVLIALGLIVSDRPKRFTQSEESNGLSFESTVARGFDNVPEQVGIATENGWDMPLWHAGRNQTIVDHGARVWLGRSAI